MVHLKSRAGLPGAIRYIVKEKGGGVLEYNGRTVNITLRGFNLFIENLPYFYKISDVDYQESLSDMYFQIEKQLFPKENFVLICKRSVSKTLGWIYYYDKNRDSVFAFSKELILKDNEKTFKYKLYRTKENIQDYDKILAEYKYYNTDYGIIDDNYKLKDWDIENIKNTDIDPELYRSYIIEKCKGQKANPKITFINDIQHNYKYFFNCEKCGKYTFNWRLYNPGSIDDYFGSELCDSCKKRQDDSILIQLQKERGVYHGN